MGAQIAAHLANAGIRTVLLDMVPKGVPAGAPKPARDALALGALQQLAKSKPPASPIPPTPRGSPPATWRTTSSGPSAPATS
jgi:hypothetical protein